MRKYHRFYYNLGEFYKDMGESNAVPQSDPEQDYKMAFLGRQFGLFYVNCLNVVGDRQVATKITTEFIRTHEIYEDDEDEIE